MSIWLLEHAERGYRGRTLFNAANADLTVAFTVDDTTAGERLTRKAATEARYCHIDLKNSTPECAARDIHQAIVTKVVSGLGRPCAVLNIAGNGVFTLERHGWSQADANQYLFEVFVALRDKWGALPSKGIRSGGQTGVDIAGAVMAYALGIDAVITFPPGYLQRGADGKDFIQTKQDVQAQILAMAAPLMR